MWWRRCNRRPRRAKPIAQVETIERGYRHTRPLHSVLLKTYKRKGTTKSHKVLKAL
jgi:hypothetical protein